MRKCDNCGAKIPFGANYVQVHVVGYDFDSLDFCSPECFEQFFTKTRWKLVKIIQKRKVKAENGSLA